MIDENEFCGKRRKALITLRNLGSKLGEGKRALNEIKKELEALDNFLLSEEK
jgi:hypothetical protein